LFGIHDILIHDKCGALGIVGDALTNLPNRTKLAKETEQMLGSDVVAEVFHEQNPVGFGGELTAHA